MTRLVFGNYPANMLDPDYLGFGQYFPADELQPVAVSTTQILLRDPVSFANIDLRGSFDLSSEAALLASTVDEVSLFTAGWQKLFEWTGLSITFADVAGATDPDAVIATALQGDDEVLGGSADDVLRGDHGNDSLAGNAGADLLLGEAGDDTLAGGDGNDALHGGDGRDVLQGGAGDDELRGDAGDDAIDGGEGTDVAQFHGGAADYVLSWESGVRPRVVVAGTTAEARLADGTDALVGVEELRFVDRTYLYTAPEQSVPVGAPSLLAELPAGSYSPQAAFATLSSGDIVVIWRSPEAMNARVLGVDLQPRGPVLQVNVQPPTGAYGVADAAGLAAGGFVAVWTSAWQDGYGDGVYGRRFAADGTPLSGEFLVTTRTDSSEGSPSVAGLADGGFVTVWDRGGPGIAAQIFDSSGAKRGGEFDIARWDPADLTYPRIGSPEVAALADGGFVVVWDPDLGATYKGDTPVVGQRYDADGGPIGSRFALDGVRGDGWWPKVAALGDGGFVVEWESMAIRQISPHVIGYEYGAFAQRFDAEGAKAGGVLEVVPFSNWNLSGANVCALEDGGFAIAWGQNNGAFATRYGSDGEVRGTASFLAASTSMQGPSLNEIGCAPLADGGFLVSGAAQWYQDTALYAQRYAADWAAAERSTFAGTALDDTMNAGLGAQALLGAGGNDTLRGGEGDDLLVGDMGNDTAVYARAGSGYAVTRTGSEWRVTDGSGDEGTDTLRSIERLRFADKALAVDLDGAAGSTAKLIGAIFGVQCLIPEFVGIGIGFFDGGGSMESGAQLALNTDLYVELAGSRSNADFVRLVYGNVMGFAPSAAEQEYYEGFLDRGDMTQAQLAVLAAETNENALNIDLIGLSNTGIEFVPTGG